MRVKICGLTSAELAVACVDAGASAIGVNFWPGSARLCDERAAAEIVRAVGARARVVAVVVDAEAPRIDAIRSLGIRWIQLHGDESPLDLELWLPEAYKAIHDGAHACFGGDEILIDARVGAVVGGTGVTCDWEQAAVVARERKLWLAGGLHEGNVREAVRRVRPFGVDVASGVESAPGIKDLEKVVRFIARAREAG